MSNTCTPAPFRRFCPGVASASSQTFASIPQLFLSLEVPLLLSPKRLSSASPISFARHAAYKNYTSLYACRAAQATTCRFRGLSHLLSLLVTYRTTEHFNIVDRKLLLCSQPSYHDSIKPSTRPGPKHPVAEALNDYGILQLHLNESVYAVHHELLNVSAFEAAQQLVPQMELDTVS